jgi:hypothetical protein
MRRCLASAVMVVSVGLCFDGPSVAAQDKPLQPAEKDVLGDWTGVLSADGTQLHVVLHVMKGEGEQLAATLDSVDQGANGIPVSVISVKDGKLSMAVAAVQGTYEGLINKDATEIKGTWTQLQPLELTFTRAAKKQDVGATAANKNEDDGRKPGTEADKADRVPSDIAGAWMGTIDAGEIKLRVVFHITNTSEGLKASLDSLDQGIKGVPVTAVTRDGTSLKIELKKIDGVYEGQISKDKGTIEGTWTQRGTRRPLVLTRTKDAAAREPSREDRTAWRLSGD